MSAFGDAVSAMGNQFLPFEGRTVFFDDRERVKERISISLYDEEFNPWAGLSPDKKMSSTVLCLESTKLWTEDGLVEFLSNFNLAKTSANTYQRFEKLLALKWAKSFLGNEPCKLHCGATSSFEASHWMEQVLKEVVPRPVRPSWEARVLSSRCEFKTAMSLRPLLPLLSINSCGGHITFSDKNREIFYDQVAPDRVEEYLSWIGRADLIAHI